MKPYAVPRDRGAPQKRVERQVRLADDVAATLQRQADERSGRFASVADVVVDTSSKSPDAVFDEVVQRIT